MDPHQPGYEALRVGMQTLFGDLGLTASTPIAA
jgi:hypothetical protein